LKLDVGSTKNPRTPAKAGAQIHLVRLVGFTWVPAFAGMSGKE
jgi:hypothetical protein